MKKPEFEPGQEVLVTCIIQEVRIHKDGFTRYLVIPKYFPEDHKEFVIAQENVFIEEKR